MRADHLDLAAHLVGLAVDVGHGAVGGPADLAYEALAPVRRDVMLGAEPGGRAHLLDEDDVAVLVYERGSGRVVTAVLEALEEVGRLAAHILCLVLIDERDYSAHVWFSLFQTPMPGGPRVAAV